MSDRTMEVLPLPRCCPTLRGPLLGTPIPNKCTLQAFAGGWFHSGDMARRDEEGFFYIVDRKKDMILTGGENVYSREVEEVLYTHPSVSEAAVIGLPDATWGERVTAVVVLRAGTDATDREIMAVARDRLAGFKTPKQVFFIDELPKNVSGKILKRELRDRFRDGADA
jgi:fatty-acyl-CoA synthase